MKAAVIGAGGAIGRALVECLATDPRWSAIHALSRNPEPSSVTHVHAARVDVGDEGNIATAAATIEGPIDLVLIATGLLHDKAHGPERALKALDPAWLARSFAINTIGPALVIKHFTPLLPRRGRSVIAALSARVGSISDNRAGGWYGYRASKAALNMVIRCAAIEIARSRPEGLCIGLHPGTVNSGLSRPFQAGVTPGKLFPPSYAAERLLAVLDGLDATASGRCFAWDGTEIPP